MRKILTLMLAFAMFATLTACGDNKSEKTDEPVATPGESVIEQEGMLSQEENLSILEAKDCFSNAGYVEFIAGAEETANYLFTAENSEDAGWLVYVFDEKFEDGPRYIGQAAEPALVGDGMLTVQAGQYVYVYCSANEFTEDAPNEVAKLNINKTLNAEN